MSLCLIAGVARDRAGDGAGGQAGELAGRRSCGGARRGVRVPVGGLQGARQDELLQVVAREARPHARRQVQLRLHDRRLQAEVHLAGEREGKYISNLGLLSVWQGLIDFSKMS